MIVLRGGSRWVCRSPLLLLDACSRISGLYARTPRFRGSQECKTYFPLVSSGSCCCLCRLCYCFHLCLFVLSNVVAVISRSNGISRRGSRSGISSTSTFLHYWKQWHRQKWQQKRHQQQHLPKARDQLFIFSPLFCNDHDLEKSEVGDLGKTSSMVPP